MPSRAVYSLWALADENQLSGKCSFLRGSLKDPIKWLRINFLMDIQLIFMTKAAGIGIPRNGPFCGDVFIEISLAVTFLEIFLKGTMKNGEVSRGWISIIRQVAG